MSLDKGKTVNKPRHTALARLKNDLMRLKKDPVPFIEAEPLPSNILEWYYVVAGPEDSPYAGGYYMGKLIFPREFPFRPPSIYMLTPNGRFKTNTRLCLSISDFHPDTWNPAWSVSTILTGLLSFMLEKSPTLGSIECSAYDRKILAYHSLETLLRDPIFMELFPELAEKLKGKVEERGEISKSELELQCKEEITIPSPHRLYRENGQRNRLQNAMINVALFCGFVTFVYAAGCIVNYSAAT